MKLDSWLYVLRNALESIGEVRTPPILVNYSMVIHFGIILGCNRANKHTVCWACLKIVGNNTQGETIRSQELLV